MSFWDLSTLCIVLQITSCSLWVFQRKGIDRDINSFVLDTSQVYSCRKHWLSHHLLVCITAVLVFNEWRRKALKRSFYGDSDMQMCHSLTHSLTHSLRCRHWNGWNGNRAVRARRHIEIEIAHHQITQKERTFVIIQYNKYLVSQNIYLFK